MSATSLSTADSPLPAAVQQAIELAMRLQVRASELQTPQERRQQAELDRLMQHAKDKATLVQITDQAFRSSTPYRAAEQLTHILDVQGVPRFFSPLERAMLRGFQSFGAYLPGVAMPLVKERMQHETANVILPAEQELLTTHLRRRREEGLRMNVNFLGEALLGEQEAERRLQTYLAALQWPDIEVMSVKISTIFSPIQSLARRHAINTLCDRLELLIRAAAKSQFVRRDGSAVPKFIYLDMEEYRDMSLTAEAFMRTLDRPGLTNAGAGIALQAYLPDSFAVQQRITAWARQRVAAGGAAVTIRLVKGANLEAEQVEAAIRGWPQAPFKLKIETDANYKRMLQFGMQSENLAAVRLGVASHNLFDVAFAAVLAAEVNAGDRVQFEMLEGMANPQRRALFELANNVLLYAPACRREDFLYAIGYLIRRLDENTGPDNFLRHAFQLRVGSEDWRRLEEQFVRSFELIEQLPVGSRRTQNRLTERRDSAARLASSFDNEPDTDFALPHNVDWAERIIADWQPRHDAAALEIPLVVDGRELAAGDSGLCRDPSRPGVIVGRYWSATEDELQAAVACAQADPDRWRDLPPAERSATLARVADELRAARADLIGAALANAGKTIAESDPEVSEAIDFVEFYRRMAEEFQSSPRWHARGRGVVVVVSPWNFPIAIPCGGIAAALAAGNTVILKPASDAVLPAFVLCQCFWRAGVSRRTLQFAPCSGGGPARTLVHHPAVDAVILTGGTETALAMLRHNPRLNLLAETGGKNATIVTALSDRDQAIKHVIHSAFSHGGQKCSATSLLILEDEVYRDESFRRSLCDAIESLDVGSAWDLRNRLGPLIRPPTGVLETGLKELEAGESWAVLPRQSPDNPHLVSPGVKWDVQPGSFTHRTEFFGPLLGVMRARNLREAIHFVNATGYGLTSGLESLDDREQAEWRDAIRAGNLYINRPTTGAIVLRQPFGGMGKSAFGPGIKAGGPNYVVPLMSFDAHHGDTEARRAEDSIDPSADGCFDPEVHMLRWRCEAGEDLEARLDREDLKRVVAAISDYESAMRAEFGIVHDDFRLLGQDNFRRYLPAGLLRIRVDPQDSCFEIMARVAAAKLAGCRIAVSFPAAALDRANSPATIAAIERLQDWTESWAGAIEFVEESDEELAGCILDLQTDRLRFAARDRVPDAVRRAAAETGTFIADSAVLAFGRIELLWYLREQSISHDYHRYGNLGSRAGESRRPVL